MNPLTLSLLAAGVYFYVSSSNNKSYTGYVKYDKWSRLKVDPYAFYRSENNIGKNKPLIVGLVNRSLDYPTEFTKTLKIFNKEANIIYVTTPGSKNKGSVTNVEYTDSLLKELKDKFNPSKIIIISHNNNYDLLNILFNSNHPIDGILLQKDGIILYNFKTDPLNLTKNKISKKTLYFVFTLPATNENLKYNEHSLVELSKFKTKGMNIVPKFISSFPPITNENFDDHIPESGIADVQNIIQEALNS